MEIKRLNMDCLSVSQMVALVDIARGISAAPPDWNELQKKLSRFDAWGFFDREELVGYGLVSGERPYLSGSVLLAELKYRWQYNREPEVCRMICQLSRQYRQSAQMIVVDINPRRDLNLTLYQKLGFKPSMIRSPLKRGNMVLVCRIDALPEA